MFFKNHVYLFKWLRALGENLCSLVKFVSLEQVLSVHCRNLLSTSRFIAVGESFSEQALVHKLAPDIEWLILDRVHKNRSFLSVYQKLALKKINASQVKWGKLFGRNNLCSDEADDLNIVCVHEDNVEFPKATLVRTFMRH